MTGWLEQATWTRRYDNNPSKGKRAKIWHCDGHDDTDRCPFYWEVKDGRRTLGFGDEPTKGAALAAVDRIVTAAGWDR